MKFASSLVFTGSYAPAGQPGVRAFAFNAQTGELAPRGEYCGITAPSYLALHPSRRWLYAVSETSLGADGTAGHIHALAYERSESGVSFTPLNERPSGGDWPCHLRLDPSGKWLVTTNYGSGSTAVLPIQADGSLGEVSALVQHRTGSGAVSDRQEGPHAHSSIFSPDRHFLIVADLGGDVLVTYCFQDGHLQKFSETRSAPGAGPRHLAFHPNGRVLYVTNELNGTLSAYDYGAGSLHERATYATLPENLPANLVADLHFSASGERVVVSNRGHNSLVVFAAAADGALSHREIFDCGGNWPRNFALSPDGRFILVANQYSGEIVSLPVQPETGAIGAPVERIALPTAAFVLFAGGAD